jgi:hypothetical protein
MFYFIRWIVYSQHAASLFEKSIVTLKKMLKLAWKLD